MNGVILYGPPACGKDTITAALHTLDERYSLYPRLKVGAGRSQGYRQSTSKALAALRTAGEILWENERYGARYAVDRRQLVAMLEERRIPVLHLGQVEGVRAVVRSTPDVHWIVADLWCPRENARERIIARGDTDIDARLRAWDETDPIPESSLKIDTSQTRPGTAADLIHRMLFRAA